MNEEQAKKLEVGDLLNKPAHHEGNMKSLQENPDYWFVPYNRVIEKKADGVLLEFGTMVVGGKRAGQFDRGGHHNFWKWNELGEKERFGSNRHGLI